MLFLLQQVTKMCIRDSCEDYQDELDEDISIDIEAIKNHQSTSRLYQYMGLFPTSTTLRSYFDDVLILTSSQEKIKTVYHQYVEETFYYSHELQSMGTVSYTHLNSYGSRICECWIDAVEKCCMGDYGS